MVEFPSSDPARLAKDADNYDVWCERCQKVHKYYTYTQEDHAGVIRQALQNMSDEIDRRLVADYGTELKPRP